MPSLLDRVARALGYYTLSDIRAAEQHARTLGPAPAHRSTDPSRASNRESAEAVDPPESPAGPVGHLKYFVAYTFSASSGTGFGSVEVSLGKPVQSLSDVQAIARAIGRRYETERGPRPTVVVLNWRRFEEPEAPDGGREDLPDEDDHRVVLRLVA